MVLPRSQQFPAGPNSDQLLVAVLGRVFGVLEISLAQEPIADEVDSCEKL